MIAIEIVEVGNTEPDKDIVDIEYADDQLTDVVYYGVPVDGTSPA